MSDGSFESLHPFSEEELYEAMRRILPDSDARSFARETVSRSTQPSAPVPVHTSSSVEYRPVESISFSEDLLALLAIQSPALERKVEEYRRALRGRDWTASEEEEWSKRKQLMRDWARLGYRQA
jgi:hypothetical protein